MHAAAEQVEPKVIRGAAAQVTRSQVAAFRLARHHLSARAPSTALVSVVAEMAGAQAQVPSAVQISLWARIRDLRATEIDAALQARILVKAWCMRRTLHLLPSRDLGLFVRGSAGRAEREIRWVRGKGVSDRVLEKLIDAALNALDRPRTGRDLVERVNRSLGVRTRMTRAEGWGSRATVPGVPVGGLVFPTRYLLHLVAARGVICSGPSEDHEPTFVRADAWIPRWRDVPRERAEQELLRRYLRAFGPATPVDFASWTGIPLSKVREIWAREDGHVAPVSIEGSGAAILESDLRELARPRSEQAPIRLLPYFDAFLLGHRDREHLVAMRYLKRVYRTQGWVAPVVLVDGRIAGVWAHVNAANRLHVRVTRFAPIPRRVAAGIREEANDLGRFLAGPAVEVQID